MLIKIKAGLSFMFDKLKMVLGILEPKLFAFLSIAPFVMGVMTGYMMRTPIGIALKILRFFINL